MHTPYRREGDTWQIDLRLGCLGQLAHSLDPSPLTNRELAPDAERYIVDAARELPRRDPLALTLWLPSSELGQAAAERVSTTVRHHFEWEAQTARRRLREHLRAASRATTLGLAFMALCMLIRSLLMPMDNLFAYTGIEGLMVIGWVALWRPVEMYLYDWWPLRREAEFMQRLASMDIALRAHGQPEAPGFAAPAC